MQAPRRRWLLGMLALGATGATRAQPAQAGRVVASFSVLADMAREVAPAGVEVTSLVGPDADAHVFKPSPADGRRLAQADLVLVNGLGFEGWIERLVRASGYRGTVAVAAEGLKARRGAGSHGHGHGHGHGHAHDVDPHAWHDLAHARHYVARIAEALATRWPDRAAEIAGRRADYLSRIEALDQRLRERLAAVPREQRRVIVSHDAFGYLGAAYGIDFFAPQGWNTHSEPSAATVARLIRQIRQHQVRAIFVENISDPRLVERIAREAGARVGGTLYSDALSRPGGPADSYLKMFEHNVTTLAQALGT
jgi:zinc/manganese transport system substrate-binding protein